MNTRKYILSDHLGGFDQEWNNPILEKINNVPCVLETEYIVNDIIKKKYQNVSFQFSAKLWMDGIVKSLHRYNTDSVPQKQFKNFICSFNGSDSVSRQFLTAIMYKFKWIDMEYFSKNFSYYRDRLDGNISNFFNDVAEESFYRKFIVDDTDDAETFYQLIYGFNYTQFKHDQNLKILSNKINESCLQIVGETLGTSRYPFVSEKFLYPIINQTLWVGYAQPGYHEYIEHYFGFKKYERIFDYKFDSITNPVIRLVELCSMLSKFEKLTPADWHDLYLLEQDTIEYNYNHYKTNSWIEKLNSV